MSRKLKALVCVAHPDDETIFFAGLILSKKYDWTILCVTDANADGKGAERMGQFKRACQKLGAAQSLTLGYPDVFGERLNTQNLIQDLKKFQQERKFDFVFTHGPLGEYGHYHHQDVCFSVHQAFAQKSKIFSVAYNTYPMLKVPLTPRNYQIKTSILQKIYAGETSRFLNFLPATSFEGYVRLSQSEVNEIYHFQVSSQKMNRKKLKAYQWLYDFIENKNLDLKSRPF